MGIFNGLLAGAGVIPSASSITTVDAGILLPQCYSDRLAEMTGQNWRAK